MENKLKNPNFTNANKFPEEEVSLLDYFAAKAMEGLLSNEGAMKDLTQAWKKSGIKDDDVYFERFAEVAYSYAKGMIKEREKHLK